MEAVWRDRTLDLPWLHRADLWALGSGQSDPGGLVARPSSAPTNPMGSAAMVSLLLPLAHRESGKWK